MNCFFPLLSYFQNIILNISIFAFPHTLNAVDMKSTEITEENEGDTPVEQNIFITFYKNVLNVLLLLMFKMHSEKFQYSKNCHGMFPVGVIISGGSSSFADICRYHVKYTELILDLTGLLLVVIYI